MNERENLIEDLTNRLWRASPQQLASAALALGYDIEELHNLWDAL